MLMWDNINRILVEALAPVGQKWHGYPGGMGEACVEDIRSPSLTRGSRPNTTCSFLPRDDPGKSRTV